MKPDVGGARRRTLRSSIATHRWSTSSSAGTLRSALKRVRRNKGSPGIDGMTVDELPAVSARTLGGDPRAVARGTLPAEPGASGVEIPKSGRRDAAARHSDRARPFHPAAVFQVLQPMFDPTFSEHSHGFRPGRSAHDAVRQAQQYIQGGRRWVVDVDLEKFFDRVNHDVLMGKLAKRIADRRMLGLIRRYLDAGIMANGVVVERHEGTPQGGPLSPLLANVLLDEVDKELERRGHRFVRYADDCNVYVQSKRAGERVMDVLRQLYARLRLRVNEEKSAVAPAWDRKFLGYSFWVAPGRSVKCRVAPKALEELKDRVRADHGSERWTEHHASRARSCGAISWAGRSTSSSPTRPRSSRTRRLDSPSTASAATQTVETRPTRVVGHCALGVSPSGWRRKAAERPTLVVASALGAMHTALPDAYFDRLGVPRLASITSTR